MIIIKKFLFALIMFLLINLNVEALTYGGCDYSTVSKLRKQVTNVNLSYDYHMIDGTPYFDVTINNIPRDVYFTDGKNTYMYSSSNNGELTIRNYTGKKGNYKFFSAINSCYGILLGTKYYKFPTYNKYYSDELCKDIPDYALCQKWTKVNYSYNEFKKKIYEYKNPKGEEEEKVETEYKKTLADQIVELYVKYYYIFLGAIIIICGAIILIKNKKDKFDL